MADDILLNAATVAGGKTSRGIDKGGKITQSMTLDVGGAGTEKLVAGFVPVGMLAVAMGTNPTAVSAGAEIEGYCNRHGIQFVLGGHPNIQVYYARFTSPQTNYLAVSQAPGGKIVVTAAEIRTSNNNTGVCDIQLGLALTTLASGKVFLSHPGISSNSEAHVGSGTGVVVTGDDAQDLLISLTDPGGAIDVVCHYCILPS